VLPSGYRLGDNDSRILAVARNLQAEGFDVTVVSKDLPLRIKASSVGLLAEEYRAELAITDSSGWTGMSELTLPGEQVDILFEEGHVYVPEASDLPVHTGLTIQSERGKALGRVTPEGNIRLVRGDREAFGIKGRSAEQRIALDLLLDPDVGIVSMGGRAGTGKSALALCAGLEASPWAQAVFDTLSAVTSREVIEEVTARGMLEVLPLTHIRGRSLHDAFVIVDEAQSLERNVLLTVLSRIGANSRVVLTHDVAQRDNLRVGRYDGVVAVVEKLKGHPLFAHVTLTRSERSQIAALVTEMLEEGQI
jgi:PhoH-like ATPase